MIRCDGFGKFLKQGLFTLLISCFILLGGSFVSAVGVYTQVGVNSVSSPVNSSYSITSLKGGGFLSNYLGVGKSVLALDTSRIFWWTPNGYPYVYLKGGRGTVEGFFDRYYSCDLMSGYNSPVNCSESFIDYSGSTSDFDYQVFKSFFSTVNQGQVVYIFSDDYVYVGSTYDETRNAIDICWNSEEIGKSFCFKGGYCYWSRGNRPNDCDFGDLVNSQNYYSQLTNGLTFGNIPLSSIGYAPGQAGYGGGGNIDGGSSDVSNSPITGDVMYSTCTKNRALNWYKRNGYSEKICYSSYYNNSDLFNGAGSVNAFALTGTDIKDIWSDTSEYLRNGNTGGSMGYSQWLHYWRNTYEVYKRNSDTYTNPFLGVPVSIFTLMGNIDIYGKPFTNESIIDYCNLLLYSSDLNSAYSGVYSSEICSQSALDVLADSVGVHAESGKVVEGSSRDGITNRPGMHNPPVGNGGNQNGSASGSGGNGNDLENYQDGLTFQNNSFNLLKGSFRFPQSTGSNGVLPSYIIIAMLSLIFFRFITH